MLTTPPARSDGFDHKGGSERWTYSQGPTGRQGGAWFGGAWLGCRPRRALRALGAAQGIASIGRRWNAWPGPSVPDELGVGVRIPHGGPNTAVGRRAYASAVQATLSEINILSASQALPSYRPDGRSTAWRRFQA